MLAMFKNTFSDNKFDLYEYMDVKISNNLRQLCCECYQGMGWTPIGIRKCLSSTTIKLKRSRRIKNRTVLCNLQRRCEDSFIVIENLERSNKVKARLVSIGTGVLGSIFIGSSLLSYLASKVSSRLILCIPGFILWIMMYFLYKKLLNKDFDNARKVIENNYNIIYEACEEARQLWR